MSDVILHGCTPEPLMSYLKALGVLRLLSAASGDSEHVSRGAWQRGVFVIQADHDESSLLRFFLQVYVPTPILAPWNGGCGLYSKWDIKTKKFKSRDAVTAINAIESSTSSRLAPYKQAIQAVKSALAELASPLDLGQMLKGMKPDQAKKFLDGLLLFQLNDLTVGLDKADKDEFLAMLRGRVVADSGLLWLDAALTLLTGRKKNRLESAVLGSGGNVGNSDFSAMFAQQIARILPLKEGQPSPNRAAGLLRAALFGEPIPALDTSSIGQFDPGKAGGANATQGMEGLPFLNPWDYVLMLEGVLLLSGSATRRFGAAVTAGSFPFMVESSAVGYGSAGRETTRGELWLPVWDRPSTVDEIRFLLSEGRAEVGRKRVRSGVDFARAVAGLGVDRGIKEFIRYEFQERLGQSYLATPVGRFPVPRVALRGIDLIRELDFWLERFRIACREEATPPRFQTALRWIHSAIFDFCRYDGPARMVDILAALGQAERELATGERFRQNERRTIILPVPPLSAEWLGACDDGTPEFRLARSLAFMIGQEHVGPLRSNLEPVERQGSRWIWAEKDRSVVWSSADLCRNMIAILQRRVMDGQRAGLNHLPLRSHFAVSPGDLLRFLAGQIDEARLEQLLWGLMLIDGVPPGRTERDRMPPELPFALPRAFTLLKLLFLPHDLFWPDPMSSPISIKPEPEILHLLSTGQLNAVNNACKIAHRRLRAAGLVPLPGPTSGGSSRPLDFAVLPGVAPRLTAALLFPLDAITQLARQVLRPKAEDLVDEHL